MGYPPMGQPHMGQSSSVEASIWATWSKIVPSQATSNDVTSRCLFNDITSAPLLRKGLLSFPHFTSPIGSRSFRVIGTIQIKIQGIDYSENDSHADM